jgi:meso-butanediol dehydrogenase/(S,S)-butanediol dehydrogenase/diacetyl reductase
MQRFEDKVVLITGAASGIGRATAIRLAAEGASIFALDVDKAGLEETQAEIGGSNFEARTCDVRSEAEVEASVAACVERFGRIDVLVNVAGILSFDKTHELSLDTWERVMAVNLTGTFLFCKHALPHLETTGGNIVNTSSTSALAGLPWAAAYAASKGGVLALTKTISVEYGKLGVRANSVCPGNIITPMTKAVTFPDGIDTSLIVRAIALDKPRGPETVAAVIAMLASEDGAHINGESVRMDGGSLS